MLFVFDSDLDGLKKLIEAHISAMFHDCRERGDEDARPVFELYLNELRAAKKRRPNLSPQELPVFLAGAAHVGSEHLLLIWAWFDFLEWLYDQLLSHDMASTMLTWPTNQETEEMIKGCYAENWLRWSKQLKNLQLDESGQLTLYPLWDPNKRPERDPRKIK